MKTKTVLVIVTFLVTIFTVNATVRPIDTLEKKTVTLIGTFDGYDVEDGYSFLVKSDSAEEEGEQTIYLQSISAEALKMVNLKSKEMEGKRFEVVYEVTEYEEKDDNGQVETFEKYHIISVKNYNNVTKNI